MVSIDKIYDAVEGFSNKRLNLDTWIKCTSGGIKTNFKFSNGRPTKISKFKNIFGKYCFPIKYL